jgi:hypothetical protein
MRRAPRHYRLQLPQHDYYYVDQVVLKTAYGVLGDAIGADVYLVDSKGKTCSVPTTAPGPQELPVDESNMAQAMQGKYREIGRLGGMYNTEYYTVAVPVVTDDNLVVGAVFASTSAQDLLKPPRR